MVLMGLEAIYRKPRTSEPHPEYRVHPHLLGDMEIDAPNQAWCSDITHIPIRRGFFPLGGGDGLGNTLRAVVATVEHDGRGVLRGDSAVGRSGAGGVQHRLGAQFTSLAFMERVLASGARCLMDGRGRCMDNVFIERLWRSLKHETVHLHDLADGLEAHQVIGSWLSFYNDGRPHSSLGGLTLLMAYEGTPISLARAA